jgi:hypothetical protein
MCASHVSTPRTGGLGDENAPLAGLLMGVTPMLRLLLSGSRALGRRRRLLAAEVKVGKCTAHARALEVDDAGCEQSRRW